MPQKHYINVAREGTFATAPSTGWIGAAVQDLGGHAPAVVTQQPKLMTYGQQGQTSKGRSSRIRGGKGQIKPYLATPSRLMLELLEAAFGAPTVTELAAGEAYEWVFSTAAAVPAHSLAVQVGREYSGGGQDRDTFVGGQVEKVTFSQGMTPMTSGVTDEGLGKVQFDLDYATMKPFSDVTQYLPTYEDPDAYFSGGDWTFSIGEDLDNLVAECVDGFGLEFMPGLNFEDAQCASSAIRSKAGRGAMPSAKLTGTSWTYKGRDYLDAWLNGTVLAARSAYEVTSLWLDGDETIHPSITVDLPALGFTGDVPKEDAERATKQDLPGDVLWNEDDDMVTVT
ncbi:MAG TPA: hypothetical protein P5254_16470, partial [Aquihabitans sp.]|nr:hypothetical protein [Aquihabitans sp.]